MNELQKLLIESPVTKMTKNVVVSERLKDFPFEISCITGTQFSDYQKQSVKNLESKKKREFNTKRFNELVVINHCVNPNFKDAEWLKQSGFSSPESLLNVVLAAGEITTLSNLIMEFSGFDEASLEEEAEDVKNS